MLRFIACMAAPLLIAPVFTEPAAPIPANQAAARMTLPEGFHATLFVGEPEVVKPIAMTVDDRGRLWVVESHCYPHWRRDGKPGNDRILIFEDAKGTGHFDQKKVFLSDGVNLSGIAVGFGGVWLCATPNLLFIPVNPSDDKPAGAPVVILDGWSLEAKHNVFNSLTWGPDGWLYGCNGILATSQVGKPGSSPNERIPFNCGVWRYHPVQKRFEPFAWGTTNPWGLDFDDQGEMFITNCVIKHLFHVVPGAHFVRMYGQDLNPHCYGLMESCADHIHWAGGDWTTSRGGIGAHGAPGGGHAHAGARVYLGDNWPDEYRNRVFMCNIHGNRINQDLLDRSGSGYVARHGKDFLLANDPWFRGLTLLYGPDGGVYVSDWCDTGECHNYERITETTGRIYKVAYGQPANVAVDLAKLNDDELVRLQLHKNDWWVRHARRLLQERAAAGTLTASARASLLRMLNEEHDVARKLRALWALHSIGVANDLLLSGQVKNADEAVRAWAIRLSVDQRAASESSVAKFVALAEGDPSPKVRLSLASALQWLPPQQRWPLAEALAMRAEDANDANIALTLWYGIEPLVAGEPERSASLLARAKLPLVRQYIARRLAEAAP